MRSDSLSLTEEVSQLSTSTSEEFSLSSSDVRGTLCFLSQLDWTPKGPDSKEGPIPCSGVNSGSSFISQNEDMSESPVENLEKAVRVSVVLTGGLTSL